MNLKLLAGQLAKLTKSMTAAAVMMCGMTVIASAQSETPAPGPEVKTADGQRTDSPANIQPETPGDAPAGQAKAATCVACHGLDGNSSNPEWPSIAGQHAEYIQKQLQAFKSGARQNPLMTPMAAPLSEQDMWDLGAYFASQTAKGLEAEPSKVASGQRLYRAGDPVKHIAACAACHGPAGGGNPAAKYPSLRGQHATYLIAQLHAYRDGKRATDQNSMMRTVAAGLSDDQMDAVTSYIQGLR